MEQQQSSYKEKERIDLREPRRVKVTIFNDDFTTMEFVVKILTTVVFKSTMEAEALMMQVHKSESAVIGIYTYDICLLYTSHTEQLSGLLIRFFHPFIDKNKILLRASVFQIPDNNICLLYTSRCV